MDLELIAIEQWGLAMLGTPAKERRRLLRKALKQTLKDIEEQLKIHGMIKKGVVIKFNQKDN